MGSRPAWRGICLPPPEPSNLPFRTCEKQKNSSRSSYRAATNTSAQMRATLNPVPHMWLDSKHTQPTNQPNNTQSSPSPVEKNSGNPVLCATYCLTNLPILNLCLRSLRKFCEPISGGGRAHPHQLSMIRQLLLSSIKNSDSLNIKENLIQMETNLSDYPSTI